MRTLAILLTAAGLVMSMLGVLASARAYVIEVHAKNLHPRWRTVPARARALWRRLTGKRQVHEVGGAARITSRVTASFASGYATHGTSLHRDDVLGRLDALDMSLRSLQRAVSEQGNRLTSRIGAVAEEGRKDLADLREEVDSEREEGRRIDTGSLDWQISGLFLTAVGTTVASVGSLLTFWL